ncbi:SRPBCC family protein [Mobilicoccus sp.]|uniref:SRPBCC family protein n=1 Tax=Mobilicoccus sp. TaxID=2034349 RepID=UPI0028AD61D0|nr:SRPBCC family protein [Mobilicoccus sp.]
MSDDKKITVSRTIDASPQEVWAVISNPARHREIDGSGQIVSDEKTDRITANGQVFTMNMNAPHMGGDYQTDNHVTGYDESRLLAWQTAPAGTEPKGWEWLYQLTPEGPNSTQVQLTYDWSKVTDKELLKKVRFPLIQEDALEDTLSRLASAVSGS